MIMTVKPYYNGMHYHTPAPGAGEAPTSPGSGTSMATEVRPKLMALDAALQRDGWTTITATGPRADISVQADNDRIVLVHEAPPDQVATIVDTIQDEGIITTCPSKVRTTDQLITLLVLLNPGTEHAILLPTAIDDDTIATIKSVLDDQTALYSVLKRPTGTRIGAVKHTTPNVVLPTTT